MNRISDAKIAQLHTEPQRSDKTRQLMLEGIWEWGGVKIKDKLRLGKYLGKKSHF